MLPNLKHKKFLDISENMTVTVIDQFENIAILDNKQKVDVRRLLDKSFYDDWIDPTTFFNSDKTYQSFTEKIKSIPDEVLSTLNDDDDPAVTAYDPEEEKRALMDKASKMINPSNEMAKQVSSLREFMDEDDADMYLPNTEPPRQPSEHIESTGESRHDVNQTEVWKPIVNDQLVQKRVESVTSLDPMIMMFKNTKKNTDFKVSFDIVNKIPRPDFIEMMEDSYEVSIIDYLSDQFTQDILRDPSIIRDKIKAEIEKVVYKKETKKRVIPNVPEESRTKLKEGVEKKVRRKPVAPKTKIVKEGEDPKKQTA